MTMNKKISDLIGQEVQVLLRSGGVQIIGKLVTVDDSTADIAFDAQQPDGSTLGIVSTVVIADITAVHRQAKKPSLVVM